ncbi:MAG: hypothetical protein Kow00129_14110 [Thermoleophilia bacterium]
MSLSELAQTLLPLNRKERYFTGTVLPMMVCQNDFKDLDVLASLLPGCELPPLDADPATTNLQFFTEYSLVESIYAPETRERFPKPPVSKDTPDVLLLARGERTVLIALEAKMYDQPTVADLRAQLAAQRVQLDYLQEVLGLDSVHHAALLPAAYARKIEAELLAEDPAFSIITWDALLDRYREIRGGDDYFMGMLALALEEWPKLAAKPAAFRLNAEILLTGEEILARQDDPAVRMIGRRGGLYGELLAKDVASGTWRVRRYEVSSATDGLAGNPNWFTVADFVKRCEGADQQ